MIVVFGAGAGNYLKHWSQTSERLVNTLVDFASFEETVALGP